MTDESLANVMAELETSIGKERLSALRRHAANSGVSVLSLLGDAVNEFVEKLQTKPTQEAAQ